MLKRFDQMGGFVPATSYVPLASLHPLRSPISDRNARYSEWKAMVQPLRRTRLRSCSSSPVRSSRGTSWMVTSAWRVSSSSPLPAPLAPVPARSRGATRGTRTMRVCRSTTYSTPSLSRDSTMLAMRSMAEPLRRSQPKCRTRSLMVGSPASAAPWRARLGTLRDGRTGGVTSPRASASLSSPLRAVSTEPSVGAELSPGSSALSKSHVSAGRMGAAVGSLRARFLPSRGSRTALAPPTSTVS
mmetsp:Transcript_10252/g.30289  ORF Transcript_10252/g.30289 Transcript_10252/m.30289 type:complete len:243 (-) Transcript_10252:1036-1764(-)